MKKVSLAILLVGLSVSFAKAQSTNVHKGKVKAETAAAVELKANTAAVAPAVEEPAKAEAMKMDEAKMKKETSAEMKQEAAVEPKAVKSSVE